MTVTATERPPSPAATRPAAIAAVLLGDLPLSAAAAVPAVVPAVAFRSCLAVLPCTAGGPA